MKKKKSAKVKHKKIRLAFPLYVKRIKGKGWAVFCSSPIKKGQIFERCPYIYLPAKFWNRLSDTPIEPYRFSYHGYSTAVLLGYGSLYNHSHSEDEINCEWELDRKKKLYYFTATKDIPANTEICHDYSWEPEDFPRWGIPAPKPAKSSSRPKKQAKRKTK